MSPRNPVLPLEGLVLLSAPPHSGASSLALTLAHAVANGTPFPGLPPAPPAPAVFASYDRLPRLSLPTAPNLYLARDLPTLDVGGWPVELAMFCRAARPALVVIDPLLDACGRRDVFRKAGARRLMATLRRLALETGATILLVHHTGIQGRTPAGSTELPRAADATILVRRVPGIEALDLHIEHDDARTTLHLTQESSGRYLLRET